VYRPRESARPSPRRGAVAVWLIVCLAVILAILAIGVDGGRMMDERQYAQAAADAAALTAGADLYENYWQNKGGDPSGTAQAAALQSAALNGYSNDGTHSVVTVNVPPQSGPFTGQAGYVEVIVESRLSAGFSAAIQPGPLSVRARAVARGQPLAIGLMALAPTGSGTLNTSGGVSLQVPNAPVIVNSSDAQAFVNSSTGLLLADSYRITGGYTNKGAVLVGPIHTGVPPSPDPLRTLPAPNPSAYPVRSSNPVTVNGGLPALLWPGVYQGGITVQGGGVAFLWPGVYVLNGGGLTVSGGSTLVGTQVLIYNTGGAAAGSITVSGGSSMVLTAPTSGTYQGISIFQDRTLNQGLTFSGGAALQIGGTVYAPSADVALSGPSGLTPGLGAFICWQLTLSGSASFLLNLGSNPPRVPDVRLVD
jgi:hypothetical protein